ILIGCGYAAVAQAEGPELRLPSFEHLRTHATESVDISFGPLTFGLVGSLMNDRDADQADVKSVLQGLRVLRVRHYEFEANFEYPTADIDAVRAQLSGPGWSQVSRIRDRHTKEDVDVYLAIKNDRIPGLAVVASGPSEFTIVNAVGSMDLKQAERLRRHFAFHHDADISHDADTSTEDSSASL